VTRTHIRCDGRINFDNDSAVINKDSYPVIDCVVNALRDNRQLTMIRVAGHTDVSGPSPYNAWLSERRAISVRKYILSKGIRAGRVFFKGYGETQQLGPNFAAAQRLANRRVEFIILEVNGRPVPRK
jgi:OOP family OmpA-OmpF porin